MSLLQKTSTVKAAVPKSKKPLSDLKEYPLPAYQFSIEFGSDTVALFQSIRGISVSRKTEPLEVGGENNFSRELPGRVSYGHVTLETGLTCSTFFWDWMMDGQLNGCAARKDFTLVQRRPNPGGGSPIFSEVHRWNFVGAFPVSWKISDLGIEDSQKIVIETLELSFYYFERGK
jgi:phage tail-like protein